ncbi:MAG: hypothetical protein P1V20_26775 [Verrucomicrobiales bacterium]|nr:hypothetical protein [Verrucomicrobiales bacterium]
MRFIRLFIIFAGIVSTVAAQDEPVRGFITLEPFELRVEALCEPKAYRDEWGLTDFYIQPSNKDRVLSQALDLLKSKTAVKSPDMEFNFDSTHTRFVILTKDLGYVPDDRDEIPLDEALIGVSMSAVCEGVNNLDIAWLWRAPGQERVPVQLSVGEDLLARYLTEEQPYMQWGRAADVDYAPKMLPLPPVNMVRRENQPILLKVGLGILALAGVIVLIFKTKTPPLIFFLIPLGAVALFGAFRFARSVPELPDKNGANDLVYSLLRNTYHAFDYRDESGIYDTLEKSISGALLEDVYLEVRKGLELEIRGGPRVRIKGIDLRKCELLARNDDAGTFDVQSDWVAVGDVNHWGHSHLRTNRYKANLRIGTFENTWKISKMQILDEERTQQVTTTDGSVQ